MTKEIDVKNRIRTMLNEAKIYRTQGLYEEAISYYENAAAIIEKNDRIKNRDALLDNISKKVREMKQALNNLAKGEASPEMPAQAQNLIKTKFASLLEKNGNGQH